MIRLGVLIFILTTCCFQSFAQQKKPVVDYSADLSNIKDQGSYVELIGNVVFYHNGVFITCDTAYRYSEQRMEGVGNVIINSDSTFVYGDKFVYNGETNIAQVYAPLIKTIDGDAVMYTHNMTFNTLESTGTYHSGGTSKQGTNIMESERGIYLSSDRSILLSGEVNMKNENYEIKSDTISYNFDSKIVTFLDKTNIWNHKGEFLVAEDGTYDLQNEVYDFYNDAYIMTTDRELWADSILYQSKLQSAKLDKNIQILDTVQQVISLGDKANYWGASGRVLLSDDPSTISYGKVETDSIFLRADTMLIIPMLEKQSLNSDESFSASDTISISDDISGAIASMDKLQDSMILAGDFEGGTMLDSISDVVNSLSDSTVVEDIAATVVDSVANIIEDVKPLSERELKKEQKRKSKAIEAEEKRLRDIEKARIRDEKRMEKLKRIVAKQKAKGKYHDHNEHIESSDSVKMELSKSDSLNIDSTSRIPLDTLVKREADSSDYFIFAIRNVKSFKVDMQMVCDSMVVNSLDSTTSLYVKPIIWNLSNQITADSLTVFSKNGAPHKAELYEFPILAQAMQDNKYNQIRGKYMEAYFKDQSIDVLYVDGNSECIYYKEEGKPGSPIDAVLNTASANMEMYFEESQIVDLKWFIDPSFKVYPIDKINEDTKEILEGFTWQVELKPISREAITTRVVRASKRPLYTELEKPKFAITILIEGEKTTFTEDGIWRDRSESLPIDKKAFLDSQPK